MNQTILEKRVFRKSKHVSFVEFIFHTWVLKLFSLSNVNKLLNCTNSSSRHLRSTQKAASFALNNFAAKAVSNFFKDKKVYNKGDLIYEQDLVFTYAYDEMFNHQNIICS